MDPADLARLKAVRDAAVARDAANPEGGNIAVTGDQTPFDPPDQAAPQPRQRVWPGSPTTPAQAGFNYTPPPSAQPQAPTPSSGGTEQGLHGQWQAFLDRPEHRAGLMQFAVNMLAGRGLGESIGGAAEATGRNIEKQQEESRYEEAEALKEQEAARKERETEFYGIGQQRKSGADTYYEKRAAMDQQLLDREDRRRWDAWMEEPGNRGVMEDVQKRFPNVKNKKDLEREENKAARDYAQQRVVGNRLGGGQSSMRGGAPSGGPQPVYDKKTGALKGYWDGKTYTPGGPE